MRGGARSLGRRRGSGSGAADWEWIDMVDSYRARYVGWPVTDMQEA